MSVYSETADAIVSRLKDSQRFGSVLILSDRQSDLSDEIDKVVQKITGTLILVTWNASKRTDPNTYGPRVSDYSITVWMPRFIEDHETPADDYAQLIEQLVDDFQPPRPDGGPGHWNNRWKVLGTLPFESPSKELLVHRTAVQIPLTLPKLDP